MYVLLLLSFRLLSFKAFIEKTGTTAVCHISSLATVLYHLPQEVAHLLCNPPPEFRALIKVWIVADQAVDLFPPRLGLSSCQSKVSLLRAEVLGSIPVSC